MDGCGGKVTALLEWSRLLPDAERLIQKMSSALELCENLSRAEQCDAFRSAQSEAFRVHEYIMKEYYRAQQEVKDACGGG